MDLNNFPSRKDILINKENDYQNQLVESLKTYDLDKIDFRNSSYDTVSKVSEKQKTYFWIRVRLREEDTLLSPNDDIVIRYNYTKEELECKFICYNKSRLDKDSEDQVINYNGKDDKKVLCLMVDSDRINTNSEDIKFIRTLFPIGRHYEYQLMKLSDLNIVHVKSGTCLDYYDIDF
jgi:phosphoribosylpyrophosphate synthetase